MRNDEKKLSIRCATERDKYLLLEWANEQFLSGTKIMTKHLISEEEHNNWFYRMQINKNITQWIVEYENISVGQIRFIEKKLIYEVDIFIIKDYRNKNIASSTLDLCLDKLFSIKKVKKNILARVKTNNKASLKFFTKFGFELSKNDKDSVELVYDCIGAG